MTTTHTSFKKSNLASLTVNYLQTINHQARLQAFNLSSLTHSLLHSLTHTLIRSLTHSLIHYKYC